MLGKKKCTAETVGRIEKYSVRGCDNPHVLSVSYTVDGKDYLLKESVKWKSSPIKLGRLTVGSRNTPVLPDCSVGAQVRVMYNPTRPQRAYLPHNKGHMTD